MRKTKIVATIGPSSQKLEVLVEMIKAGMNVARMNMSHGDYEFHQKTLDLLKKAQEETKLPVAVLMDLQGPKIRVDKLTSPLKLEKNQEWFIGEKQFAQGNFIPTIYKNLVKDCKVGDRVLFDDGLLEAQVVEKLSDVVKVKISVGGDLKSNKGINLPDTQVSAPSLTEKDLQDLEWGMTKEIDFVALSFVREAKDIEQVKEIMAKKGVDFPIVAKIEKPEAIKNFKSIVKVADVIMVARGDLAVEMGIHEVPRQQKFIVSTTKAFEKPVITATQMLESMTQNMTPTRAEATDVYNAVLMGTDLTMLSGETAAGVDPVNVIKTMDKIILEAEKDLLVNDFEVSKRKDGRFIKIQLPVVQSPSFTSNIQLAGAVMAQHTKAKVLISVTEKGVSCQRLSAFKPQTPVVGVTSSEKTYKKLCLYWGVTPYLHKGSKEVEKEVIEDLKAKGVLNAGDVVVICRANAKNMNSPEDNSVKIQVV